MTGPSLTGEDLRFSLCDDNRMFEMRRRLPVRRADRPPVVPDPDELYFQRQRRQLRAAGELTRDHHNAQGPPGSSYAYGRYGTSAYASLLRRSGHDVVRLRDRPRDLNLDPRLTVILLWPDVITSGDSSA